MKLEAFAAGLGAGILVGALMRIVETSRIAFGPYALYGNGAFAIPVILAPLAIFAGWAWLIRRRMSPGPEIATYTVAMFVGTGMGYGAAMQSIDSALGATLGIGIFLVPAAILAAITVTLLRVRRLTSTAALIAAFVFGGIVGAVPPFAYIGGLGINGISAGAAIVASERASAPAVIALGGALALLALVQAFALPLLVGGVFGR